MLVVAALVAFVLVQVFLSRLEQLIQSLLEPGVLEGL